MSDTEKVILEKLSEIHTTCAITQNEIKHIKNAFDQHVKGDAKEFERLSKRFYVTSIALVIIGVGVFGIDKAVAFVAKLFV